MLLLTALPNCSYPPAELGDPANFPEPTDRRGLPAPAGSVAPAPDAAGRPGPLPSLPPIQTLSPPKPSLSAENYAAPDEMRGQSLTRG